MASSFPDHAIVDLIDDDLGGIISSGGKEIARAEDVFCCWLGIKSGSVVVYGDNSGKRLLRIVDKFSPKPRDFRFLVFPQMSPAEPWSIALNFREPAVHFYHCMATPATNEILPDEIQVQRLNSGLFPDISIDFDQKDALKALVLFRQMKGFIGVPLLENQRCLLSFELVRRRLHGNVKEFEDPLYFTRIGWTADEQLLPRSAQPIRRAKVLLIQPVPQLPKEGHVMQHVKDLYKMACESHGLERNLHDNTEAARIYWQANDSEIAAAIRNHKRGSMEIQNVCALFEPPFNRPPIFNEDLTVYTPSQPVSEKMFNELTKLYQMTDNEINLLAPRAVDQFSLMSVMKQVGECEPVWCFAVSQKGASSRAIVQPCLVLFPPDVMRNEQRVLPFTTVALMPTSLGNNPHSVGQWQIGHVLVVFTETYVTAPPTGQFHVSRWIRLVHLEPSETGLIVKKENSLIYWALAVSSRHDPTISIYHSARQIWLQHGKRLVAKAFDIGVRVWQAALTEEEPPELSLQTEEPFIPKPQTPPSSPQQLPRSKSSSAMQPAESPPPSPRRKQIVALAGPSKCQLAVPELHPPKFLKPVAIYFLAGEDGHRSLHFVPTSEKDNQILCAPAAGLRLRYDFDQEAMLIHPELNDGSILHFREILPTREVVNGRYVISRSVTPVLSLVFPTPDHRLMFVRQIKGFIGGRLGGRLNLTPGANIKRRLHDVTDDPDLAIYYNAIKVLPYYSRITWNQFQPFISSKNIVETMAIPEIPNDDFIARSVRKYLTQSMLLDNPSAIEAYSRINDMEFLHAIRYHCSGTLRLENICHLFEEPFNLPHIHRHGVVDDPKELVVRLPASPAVTGSDLELSLLRQQMLSNEALQIYGAPRCTFADNVHPHWCFLLQSVVFENTYCISKERRTFQVSPCLIMFPNRLAANSDPKITVFTTQLLFPDSENRRWLPTEAVVAVTETTTQDQLMYAERWLRIVLLKMSPECRYEPPPGQEVHWALFMP